MDRKQHWEHVFAAKGERDVSWFEALPAISIRMMDSAEAWTAFALVETVPHTHVTPWRTSQSFQYSRLTRVQN